jgi:hypothetical protein
MFVCICVYIRKVQFGTLRRSLELNACMHVYVYVKMRVHLCVYLHGSVSMAVERPTERPMGVCVCVCVCVSSMHASCIYVC